MRKAIQVFALLLILGGIANADCTYSGASYPEGAIRGPYICVNGEWIRR